MDLIPHLRPWEGFPAFIDFQSASEMRRAHADLQARQDLGDLLPAHKLAQKVWLRDNKICFTVWDKEKEKERKVIRRPSSERPDNEEAHSNITTWPTLHERAAEKPRLKEPLNMGIHSNTRTDSMPSNKKPSSKETSRDAVSGDVGKMLNPILHEHVAKRPRLEEQLSSDMTPDPKSPNTKASLKETSSEGISGDEGKALDRKALREWWIREKGVWLDL